MFMKLYVFSTSRALNSFLLQHHDEFLPKTMTIGEFFTYALFVKDRIKASPLLRKIFLAQVLKDFDFSDSQKEHLFFEYNFLGFLETSSFLLDFFNELFASQIQLCDVLIKDTYGEFEDHLRVIDRISQAYQKKLSENGFYDFSKYGEIFWDFLKNFDAIELFIDGFLSSFEWQVLSQVAERTSLIFHLNLDSYNLNHFLFLNSQLRPDFSYTIAFPSGEILQSSKRELKSQFSLVSCQFRSDQCAVLIQKINEWLELGIDPEKIAIVAPKEDFLPFLEACDLEGNFNFAMGRSSHHLLAKLEELKQSIPSAFSANDHFSHLKEVIEEKFKDLSHSIREQVFELLLVFEQNLHYLENFSFAEIVDLFVKEAKQIREEDAYGGKIRVIGMLETRGIQFEKVILLDCVQDNIPSFSDEDMFLSSSVRQNLKMPTVKDKQDLQKHFYLELFKNSQEVCILFAESQPASFIREIGIHNLIQQNRYTLFPPSANTTYQEDKITATLNKDFECSSSKLTIFKQCKRKFYFAYINNLREKEEKRVMFLGNIVHQSLCEAYQDLDDLTQAKKRFDAILHQKQDLFPMTKVKMELELMELQMKNFWEYELAHLPDQILFLEHSFEFVWEGWKFVGRLDRVDLKDGVIRIIDYKFSNKKTIDSIQSAVYFLYVQNLFPDKTIEVFFCALKEGQYHQDAKIEDHLQELKDLLDELKAEEAFEKTSKTSSCRECAYQILCNR